MINAMPKLALLLAAITGQAALAGMPTYYPRGDDLPLSEAVQVGDILYMSGITGTGTDGKVVSGGIEAESRRAMDRLGETLLRRGLGYDAVFQCNAMLTDMTDRPAFNAIYRTYFKSGRYPARATYGTSGLAQGARLELQCNAWNPRRKK